MPAPYVRKEAEVIKLPEQRTIFPLGFHGVRQPGILFREMLQTHQNGDFGSSPSPNANSLPSPPTRFRRQPRAGDVTFLSLYMHLYSKVSLMR